MTPRTIEMTTKTEMQMMDNTDVHFSESIVGMQRTGKRMKITSSSATHLR